MAQPKIRFLKNKLFKGLIYTLVTLTLLLFLGLFAFVAYKGVEGIREETASVNVDFSQVSPLECYHQNQSILQAGALKHLYELHNHSPSFKGKVKLPAKKGNEKQVAWWFFTQGDSRYAEVAGLYEALRGSFYLLLITVFTALPIGLCAGIYLEELAPRRALLAALEIIISNLAAVPSILYGLLGLAIFIYLFNLPRSSALVGGLTLALMSLPTLVSSTRLALRSVPKSLRDSARALGASSLQVTFHHVVPFAFPAMVTGILISMARVFGETAPLLIVGLMVFNPATNATHSVTEASTTLPVQIFMWARNPEPQFIAKAAAAILVLIAFLGIITAIALKFRRSYDSRF